MLPPAPERRLILTRAEYQTALDALLPLASKSIQVFDPDLVQPALHRPARLEALRAFRRPGRDNVLQIVVHDLSHIERGMPRLVDLLREFPTRVSVHRSEGDALRAQDCFVLVDARHFVRRPVAAQSRGVYALEEPHEGHQLRERFEQILAASEPGLSATRLGL